LLYGQVHVVVVVAGDGSIAAITLPADAGLPDALVPNDVQDAESAGVRDAPRGQVVAVGLVAAARPHVGERRRVGREIAGAPLRAPPRPPLAPALRIPGEASFACFVVRFLHALRDAAAGAGRVLDGAPLRRERTVGVAPGGVRRRLAAGRAGDRLPATGLAQRV